uniref:NADH-ubiquinone oxidoreductase chain 4 n=1 Tax=Meranoplus bicolor TaxID=611886 RepID=A0A8K1VDL9_9HYME|nr:NADH dehydrogenase subunit 4 [Meranoplus bicolor]
MMKFFFMYVFMIYMLVFNKVLSFYYNMLFFGSFMMIVMYMFKDYLWGSIFVSLGVEFYSFWLIVLSVWILSLMIMSLEKFDFKKMMVFMILLSLLLLFFMSMDLFMFYLMFEVSLIPTFFLIIYWGGSPERLSAAYYLMMYMLLISFPFLIYLFQLNLLSMSVKFSLLEFYMNNYDLSFWGYLFMFLAFYIKLPLYIYHVWLPKAHVEAPVYGSMILAGVLLKMGGYGLIRFLIVFTKMGLKFNYWILSLGVVGSFLISILCLVQIDMKMLVAYSSVVHMNIFLCGLMTLFKLGMLSGYIVMVSHGLCSSGMFYMVNMYYLRSGSRLLMLNKSSLSKLSSLAIWWFLFCVVNFSFPFSMGFISEIMVLMTMLSWSIMMMFYVMIICFFSSAYSLYLYSYIQHGSESCEQEKFSSGVVKEYMVMINHLYPMILLLLNLLMFM